MLLYKCAILKKYDAGDRYEISHYSFFRRRLLSKAVEFYNKQLDVDFLKTALSQNGPYRIIKQKMIMFYCWY